MTTSEPVFTGAYSAALPTMYDLPSENPEEPGLADEFHLWQPLLLGETFQPPDFAADRIFSGLDLNLYYDLNTPRYYKRPDWFGVVDVPRILDRGRQSYVIWQERQVPTVVVELLSPSTLEEDQGQSLRGRTPPSKWEVYERILGVPYYVLFNRMDNLLRLFRLSGGQYQELAGERLWIEELHLGLGLWQGEFKGFNRRWLRWFDAQERWLPTAVEQERLRTEQAQYQAEQERLRAEQERSRAEQAEAKAAAMREHLRQLGIDPETEY